MLTNIIWLVAVALEIAILFRGAGIRAWAKYPCFYSYLGYVLVQDFLRMIVYSNYPSIYGYVYWSTQFVGLLFGCGLVWEIYRLALAPFPGAQRVSRYAFALIGLVLLLKSTIGAGDARFQWVVSTTLDLERDLRFVQAVALSALISVFAFYGLQLGRNLLSLILGYGVFVATSLVNLAVRAQIGDGFQKWWVYLQPSLYVVVLLIWCAGLWSHSVIQSPAFKLELPEDYTHLVKSTKSRLGDLQSRVNKGVKA